MACELCQKVSTQIVSFCLTRLVYISFIFSARSRFNFQRTQTKALILLNFILNFEQQKDFVIASLWRGFKRPFEQNFQIKWSRVVFKNKIIASHENQITLENMLTS